MHNDAGDVKTFIFSRIEGGKLTVDGNHPLAGKTLNTKVRVLSVRDVTEEDAMLIATGNQGNPTLN